MNSVTTSSAISELTRVLLDANIIAKPVTRTLLVVGGVPSGFRASPRTICASAEPPGVSEYCV